MFHIFHNNISRDSNGGCFFCVLSCSSSSFLPINLSIFSTSFPTAAYTGCVYADNSLTRERVINELNVFYQVNIGDKQRIVVSRIRNLYICPPEEKIYFDACDVLKDNFAGVLGNLFSHLHLLNVLIKIFSYLCLI